MNLLFDQYNIIPLTLDGAVDFHKLVRQNVDRLKDYFPGTVANTQSVESTYKYLSVQNLGAEQTKYLPFLISHTSSQKFVGFVDVKRIDWKIPKGEMGYFIDTDYRRLGVISKAFSMIVDYLNQEYQFKKLACRVAASNQGSVGVVRKAGFELEGTIRNEFRLVNGELIDIEYYGRVF